MQGSTAIEQARRGLLPLGVLRGLRPELRLLAAVTWGLACATALVTGCVGSDPVPSAADAAAAVDANGTHDAPSDAATTDGGGLDDAADACAYAAAVLADKPLHYVRFASSQTVVRDEVNPGSASAGRFVNGARTEPGALSCPGGDFAAVTARPERSAVLLTGSGYEFEGKRPFSVELWFRAGVGSQEFARLFAREHINPDAGADFREGYGIVYDEASRRLSFGRYFGSQSGAFADTAAIILPALPASFTHVIGTYDGAAVKLYVNGDLADTKANATGAVPKNTAATMLGARAHDNGTPNDGLFTGGIDEVAVYDFALSPERVKAHYVAAK